LEIGLILLNPGRAGEEGEKTYFLSVLLHVDISAPIAGADPRDRNVEGRVVPLAPPQTITKSKGRWLLPLNEVFKISAQEIAERISPLVAPREEASASALELRYWTRPWTADRPLGRTLILMKTIRSDAERTNHTSLLLKDSPGTYPGQPPGEPTYSALSGYVRISRSETYIANEMAAPTPPPPNLTNLNAVVVSPSRGELLGSDQ
jgi:hypothetical protein